MEFNKLPEGFEGSQKRRIEFKDENEKLQYDARNLIKLAEEKTNRKDLLPIEIASFSTRQDDDIEALKKEIAIQLKKASEQLETFKLDPCLAQYKTDYNKWSNELKQKITWEKIQTRLFENNKLQFFRALALNKGGVMFGVDENGKALFADAGAEPIMTGMNYANSRDAVRFTTNEKGKKTETGYEMFPEDLIKAFEQFTGHPIVASDNREEWRGIWLESGDTPTWVHDAYFNPGYDNANVGGSDPRDPRPQRGVRRLLRV